MLYVSVCQFNSQNLKLELSPNLVVLGLHGPSPAGWSPLQASKAARTEKMTGFNGVWKFLDQSLAASLCLATLKLLGCLPRLRFFAPNILAPEAPQRGPHGPRQRRHRFQDGQLFIQLRWHLTSPCQTTRYSFVSSRWRKREGKWGNKWEMVSCFVSIISHKRLGNLASLDSSNSQPWPLAANLFELAEEAWALEWAHHLNREIQWFSWMKDGKHPGCHSKGGFAYKGASFCKMQEMGPGCKVAVLS